MRAQAELEEIRVGLHTTALNTIKDISDDAHSNSAAQTVPDVSNDVEMPEWATVVNAGYESNHEQSGTCTSSDASSCWEDCDDESLADSTDYFGNVFDMRNLEDIDSWEIHDKELKSAVMWFIWKVEGRVSDNAFARRSIENNID